MLTIESGSQDEDSENTNVENSEHFDTIVGTLETHLSPIGGVTAHAGHANEAMSYAGEMGREAEELISIDEVVMQEVVGDLMLGYNNILDVRENHDQIVSQDNGGDDSGDDMEEISGVCADEADEADDDDSDVAYTWAHSSAPMIFDSEESEVNEEVNEEETPADESGESLVWEPAWATTVMDREESGPEGNNEESEVDNNEALSSNPVLSMRAEFHEEPYVPADFADTRARINEFFEKTYSSPLTFGTIEEILSGNNVNLSYPESWTYAQRLNALQETITGLGIHVDDWVLYRMLEN